MKRRYPFLTEWAVDHPWATIAVLLALALACGAGVTRLEFSNDIEVFFSEDDPKLQTLRKLEDSFGDSRSILFVVAPRDGNVFTPETLGALARLTDRAWKLPFARRVDSIVNFQHSYANGDDLVVEDLIGDPAGLSPADIERIRDIALGEPRLVDRLVSPSGSVAGVNVRLRLPDERPLEETPEAANAARALAKKIMDEHPGVDVRLTGVIMINAAIGEVGARDLATLVPIMLGVALILLGLILRSVAASLLTLVVILLSILAAMGLSGWIGVLLSPPCVSAANIIMTLAIADSVHLLVTFFQLMGTGMPKREAVLESVRVNYVAVLVTSFTTVVGFLTMNTSESPPFRNLGNIVAIGVAAAWVFAAYMVPAMMAVLPLRQRRGRTSGSASFLSSFAESVIAWRKPLLIGMLVLAAGLALLIPRNQLDDEFVKYFDEKVPFRSDTEFTIRNLTGFEFIEYAFGAGQPEGISDPGYLEALDGLTEWLRAQPKVRHVSSYTDTLKQLNMNLHGDDPAWFRIPESPELAAQYLLLFEMSLPFGLDITDQVSLDKSATLLHASLNSITSNEMLDLERRAQEWLDRNAPRYRDNPAAGQPLTFAHVSRRNIKSLLASSVAALFVISLLLAFTFRSVRFGLVSILPNLAPAAMAFGLWGFFVGRVGLALSVVVGMTLGIVVDDTVHFIGKYLHARREKEMPPEDAIRFAFRGTGAAMIITSAILILGFGVLMLSEFELNSGMGLLSAVTIFIALFNDLVLLPPLLLMFDRTRKGEAP